MNSITNTHYIGKVLHFIEIVNSTNDYAKELLANTSPIHGTVILSFCQTSGRGQYGRKWQAEKNESIAMSVILLPQNVEILKNALFSMNKAIAIAVAECVKMTLGNEFTVQIKWPNDILVNHRKIAGILIENQFSGNLIKNSIVGVGVNINQSSFPPEIPHAVSMKMLDEERRVMSKVVNLLAQRLDKWLIHLYENQISFIENTYNEWLWRKGTTTKFFDEKGVQHEGVINSVDNQGKLILSQNEVLHSFTFGQIRFDINQ